MKRPANYCFKMDGFFCGKDLFQFCEVMKLHVGDKSVIFAPKKDQFWNENGI